MFFCPRDKEKKRKVKNGSAGFTLIELLIYAVIFSIASGLLTGILVTISNVQTKENAAFEVTRQLQFVTQRIQYTIRDASIVQDVYEGDTPGTSCTTFCSVRLRVEDDALDPTIVSSDANGVYIKEGANPKVALTSPNVHISSLIFNRVGNPGGLSTVTMDIALVYDAPDSELQITRTLSSAIAHVSAATFDTDLLPDATDSRSIGGSALKWKDITVSNGITVSGPAGVGEFAGFSMARSTTHGSSSLNEYYVTSSPYDKYGARFDVGGTPMLYLEGDINQTGRRAYFLNGNVGIGTTSPDAPIHANGGTAMTAGWNRTAVLSANYPVLVFKSSSKYAGIGYDYSSNLNIWVNAASNDVITGTHALAITQAGSVGIGRTPSYKLDVGGDLRISGTPYRDGGDIAWAVPSDARLKDVTGAFNYGLSDLNKLNVVKFRYKEGNELGISSDKEYGGLIAQDVQKVIPEAVFENKGYLALNSTPIMWTMLNSIKELSAKVDAQQVTIDELKAEVKRLEAAR